MDDYKNLVEQMNTYLENEREGLRDFLCRLVSIESRTYHEEKLARFIADAMYEFGYDQVITDQIGNVLGRIGFGKKVILYDAHMDTVDPGDANDWGFDPLSPVVKEGAVYGRGAVDDKGCLAGIIYAGKAIKALGLEGDFTLWVSASISEEDMTGACVREMVEKFSEEKPQAVLVAEPSENRLIRGHKGRALLKITVPGKAAHASAAQKGENALIKALPVIEGLHGMSSFKEDPFLGKGTLAVTFCDCKTPSLNTIPGEVKIVCDRRITAGETMQELLDEIQCHVQKADGGIAEIETKSGKTYKGYPISCEEYCPSWYLAEDHPLVASGKKAYAAAMGTEPVVGKWDFCTNATYLCGNMGIPCMGFGPGDGSLCHTTEEKIHLDELMEAIKFYILFPFVFNMD